MRLTWSGKATADLIRLQRFIGENNPKAADRIINTLRISCDILIEYPHIGRRHEKFNDQEMRCFISGKYEIWYEIKPDNIYIARVWHTREDR